LGGLRINGADSNTLDLPSGDLGLLTGTGNIRLRTNNTDVVWISNGGQVGIGLGNGNSPSNTLQINGTSTGGHDVSIQGTGTDIGLALNNTGTGGHDYEFISTNNGSAQGGGKFLLYDITNGLGEFSINSSGAANFENSSNSTTAFQVQNASSTNVINVDTTNLRINVGSGSTGEATASLLVLDSKTGSSSDPTQVNGAMYYNVTDNSFRCGENGVWRSCLGGLVNSSTAASSAISNTNSLTNFSGGTNNSYGILANDCQPGVTYLITAQGVYSTTGTPTLALYLNEDGTATSLANTA